MTSIQYLTGDATAPQSQGNKIICHVCNDIGGWGKGFVLACDRDSESLEKAKANTQDCAEHISFHNNAIDHFGGHTFGCHENYLVRVEDKFFADALSFLLPFLVTRQIYAGIGRVGGHRLTRPSSKTNILNLTEHEVDYVWVSNFYGVEIDKSVDFQLSQRADHIVKTVSSRVRFNRAIIIDMHSHQWNICFCRMDQGNVNYYTCVTDCEYDLFCK